jgi:hypothetical protein
MKRFVFALGLAAATAFAAPLAAQSRNDGPWWDPANTGSRGTVDTRSRDGRIYDSRRADGQWRRIGRDRNGDYVYERTRRERNGNVVLERARRDSLGRYRIIDRRVIQSDRRNDRYDDRYDDRYGHGKNDRWDQNNGHDNGKHNGWYKNKGKSNRGRHR